MAARRRRPSGALIRPAPRESRPMTDVNPLTHRFYLREIERLAGPRRGLRPAATALIACLALAGLALLV
jgi:hypothetical protein